MKRKYQPLDVVKMFSTLQSKHWRKVLITAVKANNVGKLTAWRYGMQLGLAEANNRNISSETINIWAIQRIRDLEKAMKVICRKKYPNPFDDPKVDPLGYIHKVKLVKRQRDREFEDFLRKSSY